jgi:hypothetical protein
MITVVAAWLLLASAGRTSAWAAQDARAIEAKKACLAGRWEQGIELLADLYAQSNDPNYIYNQGRCFQQNGRGQDAITRFREYLRKASDASAGERAQVEGYIREIESSLPATPVPVVVAAPDAPAPAAPSADGDRRRSLRLGGIAIASAGALITAGGIVMGLRVRNLSAEVSNAAAHGKFEQSKYDAGRRAETLQWVGIGVGAAAIVAGGALLVIAGRDGGQEVRTTALVAPLLGPSLVGGTVQVRF